MPEFRSICGRAGSYRAVHVAVRISCAPARPVPRRSVAMQAQLMDAQRFLAERRFVDAARICEQLLVARAGNDRELEELLDLARRGVTPAGLGRDGQFRLAVALQRAQLLPDAAREYRELLRWMPDAAEVHNNLGSVLQALGETAAAAASFEG